MASKEFFLEDRTPENQILIGLKYSFEKQVLKDPVAAFSAVLDFFVSPETDDPLNTQIVPVKGQQNLYQFSNDSKKYFREAKEINEEDIRFNFRNPSEEGCSPERFLGFRFFDAVMSEGEFVSVTEEFLKKFFYVTGVSELNQSLVDGDLRNRKEFYNFYFFHIKKETNRNTEVSVRGEEKKFTGWTVDLYIRPENLAKPTRRTRVAVEGLFNV